LCVAAIEIKYSGQKITCQPFFVQCKKDFNLEINIHKLLKTLAYDGVYIAAAENDA